MIILIFAKLNYYCNFLNLTIDNHLKHINFLIILSRVKNYKFCDKKDDSSVNFE